MRRAALILTGCLVTLFVCVAFRVHTHAAAALALPVEASGPATGYPLEPDQVAALRSSGSSQYVRQHGWSILMALTPAKDDSEPNVENSKFPPLWDLPSKDGIAWKNKCDLGLLSPTRCVGYLPQASNPPCNGLVTKPGSTAKLSLEVSVTGLEDPVQLRDQAHNNPSGTLASVLFNQEAGEFIQTHRLQNRRCLDQFENTQAESLDGKSNFSSKSLVAKLIWAQLGNDNLLRVYDHSSRSSAAATPHDSMGSIYPASGYWPAITVDPQNPNCDATTDGTPQHPIGLGCFYFRTVDCQQQITQTKLRCATGEKKKVLILMGMHVITAEQNDWVWSTFFWSLHPDGDPDHLDQIKDLASRGPWAHYSMETTLEQPAPNSQPNATLNPYLEGQMDHGLSSNCMYCHSMAHAPPSPKTATQVTAASIAADGLPCTYKSPAPAGCKPPVYTPTSNNYDGMTPTHMLWTLADAQDSTLFNGGTLSLKVPLKHPAVPKITKPIKTLPESK